MPVPLPAPDPLPVPQPPPAADPLFLAAARRHILKAWRYQPATEGGAAIGSTTTITLEFRLDS